MEKGLINFQATPTHVDTVLRSIETLLSPLAREKGLEFVVDIAPEFHCAIVIEASALRRILLNLGSNAVKFTQEGKVIFKASSEGHRFLLEVTDTGIGMAKDQMERIFDPFVQVDSSMTRDHGGTGLGLSICRSMVASMAGELSVQSQPEVGSTFTLSLPLYWQEQAPESTKTIHLKKVLIVDDDPNNLVFLKAILERRDFEVSTAEDGRDCLEKMEGETFGMILLDIHMPVMDGIETFRVIRREGVETLVVGMSSHTDTDEILLYRKVGFDDFLPKPIAASTIEELV